MLNPWRLRLLHQLHLLGTVRAVAEALHMSPSSVSAQLAVLEEETRAQLFERVGRRIELTPVGASLAVRAGELLDHIGSIEAEIASLHSEPTGLVRVAAFASAMRSIVIPAVQRLERAFPRIRVHVFESEPHLSVPGVQRGEFDIAVSADFADGFLPVDPNLATLALADDDVALVVAASRTDLDASAVALSSLSAESWALESDGTYLADLAERLCRKAGFEPRVVGRFSSYGALLRHVEAGLSVTLLPMLAVDDRYRVRTIEIENPVTRQILLVARRTATARVAVGETIAAIREAARAAPHQ